MKVFQPSQHTKLSVAIYLAGLVIEVDEEGVGETGDPGVDFLSLQGELQEVFSPERRSEFCRLKPVPIGKEIFLVYFILM